jgi:hypothetical protein
MWCNLWKNRTLSVHRQIFITGVWWSGAYLLADIASINGYDLGRRLNSRNDNVYAWKTGPFYSMDGNASPGCLQDILETKWPFDDPGQEEIDNFYRGIINARSPHDPENSCCKLSTLTMMTPLVHRAFPKSPVINVIRNPVDVSMYESDNYFLRLLMQDRVSRPSAVGDIDLVDAIGYLFTGMGDLRWKIQPTSKTGWHVETRVKPILWNLLYVLRWAMVQDRLNLDIKNHNIKNVHNISFEKIVSQDKEELNALQDILQIPGKLKLPKLPVSELSRYKDTILPALQDNRHAAGAERILNVIYHMCEPYLEQYGYTETIEIFKKLRVIR